MKSTVKTRLVPSRRAFGAACAALVLAGATQAHAQEYPSRPIRFVSPFAPGGGTDIFARALAKRLSESMGVSVIVENRSGAGGTIGTEYVINQPADGYTILLGSPSPLTVAPSLSRKLSYDPQKDLAPLTLAAIIPNLLVVNPSLPIQSVKDLIAHAKANPGKVTFASSGNGGSGHLHGTMFSQMTGVKMIHVPYRGSSQAAAALVGGEVNISFGDMLNTLPQVKAGRLRALAVTTIRRSPAVPDVPTVAEAGVPGFDASTWYGVLVAAKTPPAIVSRLAAEMVKGLNHPEVRESFARDGGVLIASTPEQFAEHIRVDTARWAKVIAEAGLKGD